jgi:hypothetical protein
MATQPKTNIESFRGMKYLDYIEQKKLDTTLQFQFDPFFSNERVFLKGFGKILFYICVWGYMIMPLILIPIFAYEYDNWYLLFGLAFSYFSTFLALKKKSWLWAAPLIPMIIFWIKTGFHMSNYFTFFYICAVWGGWMYSLAIGYEDEFAKIQILKNPELFNDLSEKEVIFFMRKV